MWLFQRHAATSQHIVSLCFSVAACCILSALVLKGSLSEFRNLDPYYCGALKTKGRWCFDYPRPRSLADSGWWQPTGCMLHNYNQRDIEECLRGRTVVFVGDSTVRRLFWAAASKIDAFRAQEMELAARKQSDEAFEQGNTKLQFIWDPYLNATSDSSWLGLDLNAFSPWNGTSTAAVIFGSGLWYAKNMGDHHLDAYKTQVKYLMNELSSEPRTVTSNAMLPPAYRPQPNRTPIFLPIIQPDTTRLDESRSESMTPERLKPMNDFLQEEATSGRIELFQSFGAMTRDHPWAFEPDGLHASDHMTSIQANMMLNFLCNSQKVFQTQPYDKTCCNVAPAKHLSAYLLAVLFILLLLVVAIAKLRSLSVSYQKTRDNGSEASLVILFLAVVYCVSADRSYLFEKANKPVNLAAFVLLSAFGLISGFATANHLPPEILPTEKDAIIAQRQEFFLSRQQSEEWKGWMQLLILLYHYFGMSKVLWVYQVARLLVASYLFMSGFGHTTYFLKTKDFSLHRIAAVLLRMNLLSCTLGYVMFTSYDFYYFSALSSFWFIVTFCTLRIGNSGDINVGGLVVRCLGSVVCVNSFIHLPGLLERLSRLLHLLFRINFHAQEFRFRVALDVYIVYVGVVVGWLYHHRHDATLCSWLDSNVRQTGRLRWAIDSEFRLFSFLRIICATVLLSYLFFIAFLADKYQYNRLHPWISPIFVVAYVLLRNSSQRLRKIHCRLFAWLGRCSLETYILQCHIWLAGDTKGLLRLGILKSSSAGDLIEFIVITAGFVWTSWHASKATNVLSRAVMGLRTAEGSTAIAKQLVGVFIALSTLNWVIYVFHTSH